MLLLICNNQLSEWKDRQCKVVAKSGGILRKWWHNVVAFLKNGGKKCHQLTLQIKTKFLLLWKVVAESDGILRKWWHNPVVFIKSDSTIWWFYRWGWKVFYNRLYRKYHKISKPSAFESEIHPSHKPTVYAQRISPLQGAKSRRRDLYKCCRIWLCRIRQ